MCGLCLASQRHLSGDTNASREVLARSVGLGAAFQRLIPGRTIWIADAHRDDGKRFVALADEKLTAFMNLEAAVDPFSASSFL